MKSTERAAICLARHGILDERGPIRLCGNRLTHGEALVEATATLRDLMNRIFDCATRSDLNAIPGLLSEASARHLPSSSVRFPGVLAGDRCAPTRAARTPRADLAAPVPDRRLRGAARSVLVGELAARVHRGHGRDVEHLVRADYCSKQ